MDIYVNTSIDSYPLEGAEHVECELEIEKKSDKEWSELEHWRNTCDWNRETSLDLERRQQIGWNLKRKEIFFILSPLVEKAPYPKSS